jgi:hypothetical protein
MIERTYELYSRLPKEIKRSDAERAFELLSEFGQENELTTSGKEKTPAAGKAGAAAQAIKELALAEITMKYDFYEKLFAAVFAERKAIREGFFRVIDQGIREKNNDLVLAGLSSLSGMVSSSPLTNLGSLNN